MCITYHCCVYYDQFAICMFWLVFMYIIMLNLKRVKEDIN